MTMIFYNLAAIGLILTLALLLSYNRRAINLRIVGAAFGLQFAIALFAFYIPFGHKVIETMSFGVTNLLHYADAGTNFIFGPLATPEIGGNSFAIAALPVIIFFSALVSVLYHIRVMHYIIRFVGGALQKLIGVSRVELLCAAANIFVGQSESPLVIRPFLAALKPAQLFTVMSVGMAGVAGTILAAYAKMGINIEYLLAAAFMSAPGGILMAKLIMPDDPDDKAEEQPIANDIEFEDERAANVIMAAAMGAQTGVKLAVAVGAMVLAFVALIALVNGLLGGIGGWFGYDNIQFQNILGAVFAPIMFLIGVPWEEAMSAGGLFGTKIVLNEFVAFLELGNMSHLSARSQAIITFALCGFANFSSIAIQMAVTGGLAPNQRPMIAKLGLKALAAGSLANLMSAALVGLMLTIS